VKQTTRVLGIALLLVVTGGLCVQYAAADLWAQPTGEDVIESPDATDGEQGFVFAEVLSVDRSEQTAVVEIQETPQITLTVERIPPAVIDKIAVGGSIQIYGTFGADGSVIVADRIIADFGGVTDRYYTYGSSILGGLIAAGVFFRYWRVDLGGLRFTPRGEE